MARSQLATKIFSRTTRRYYGVLAYP